MAFAIKYKATYQTVTGTQKEIHFSKDGYEGDVTEWWCGETPIVYEKGDSDTLFGHPIVSTIATISLNIPYQLDITEFLEDRQQWLVQVMNLDSATVEFSGWVEPYDGSKPYSRPPHEVTLKASCGLSHLRKIRYNPTVATHPVISILHECLLLTGHNFPLLVTALTKENSLESGERVLEEISVNTDRYYDGEGRRLYAYEIIEDILHKFNAELFQHGQQWRLRSISDQAQGYNIIHAYEDGVYAYTLPTILNQTYEINGESATSLSLDGGQNRALAPVRKYTAIANVAPYANMMPNGDLRHSSNGDFTGWTNVGDVPGGTQVSSDPNVVPNYLRITGSEKFLDVFRYEPASVFSSKSEMVYNQPARYIKSPAVSFGRYVGKLKLTGTYSTSAPEASNSLTVILGIRITSTSGTKERWLDAEGVWRPEWRFVKFPAAQLITTRDGVKSEPGKIEIELDFNVLNATFNLRALLTNVDAYNRMEIRLYQVLCNEDSTSASRYVQFYGFKVEPVKQSEDSQYELTLQTDSVLEDEGETVNLMTADYLSGFTGTLLLTDTGAPTGSWKRQGRTETVGLLWAMLADRLAMMHRPMKVTECEIKAISGLLPTYQNFFRFLDQGEERYKATRWQWDDRMQIATVTAVELRYEDATLTKVTKVRDATQPRKNGRVLVDEEVGSGGVVLPSEEPDAGNVQSARVGAEDAEFLTSTLPRAVETPRFAPIPVRTFYLNETNPVYTINLVDLLQSSHAGSDLEIVTTLDHESWVDLTWEGMVLTLTGTPPGTSARLPKLIIRETTYGNQIIYPLTDPDIIDPSTLSACTEGPTILSILEITNTSLTYQFHGLNVNEMYWRIKAGNLTLETGVAIPDVEPDEDADAYQQIVFPYQPDGAYTLEVEGRTCSSSVSSMSFHIGEVPTSSVLSFYDESGTAPVLYGNLASDGSSSINLAVWDIHALITTTHTWWNLALYKKSGSAWNFIGQRGGTVAQTDSAEYSLFNGGDNTNTYPGAPHGAGGYEVQLSLKDATGTEVLKEHIGFLVTEAAPTANVIPELYDADTGIKVLSMYDGGSYNRPTRWNVNYAISGIGHDYWQITLKKWDGSQWVTKVTRSQNLSGTEYTVTRRIFGSSSNEQYEQNGELRDGSYQIRLLLTLNGDTTYDSTLAFAFNSASASLWTDPDEDTTNTGGTLLGALPADGEPSFVWPSTGWNAKFESSGIAHNGYTLLTEIWHNGSWVTVYTNTGGAESGTPQMSLTVWVFVNFNSNTAATQHDLDGDGFSDDAGPGRYRFTLTLRLDGDVVYSSTRTMNLYDEGSTGGDTATGFKSAVAGGRKYDWADSKYFTLSVTADGKVKDSGPTQIGDFKAYWFVDEVEYSAAEFQAGVSLPKNRRYMLCKRFVHTTVGTDWATIENNYGSFYDQAYYLGISQVDLHINTV